MCNTWNLIGIVVQTTSKRGFDDDFRLPLTSEQIWTVTFILLISEPCWFPCVVCGWIFVTSFTSSHPYSCLMCWILYICCTCTSSWWWIYGKSFLRILLYYQWSSWWCSSPVWTSDLLATQSYQLKAVRSQTPNWNELRWSKFNRLR